MGKGSGLVARDLDDLVTLCWCFERESNTYDSAAQLMQSLMDWDSDRRCPQPGQL